MGGIRTCEWVGSGRASGRNQHGRVGEMKTGEWVELGRANGSN